MRDHFLRRAFNCENQASWQSREIVSMHVTYYVTYMAKAPLLKPPEKRKRRRVEHMSPNA
jgi:hypothetical protein